MHRRANLVALAFAVIPALMFAGIIWMKASVWTECRVDRSWAYCVHLIGGR